MCKLEIRIIKSGDLILTCIKKKQNSLSFLLDSISSYGLISENVTLFLKFWEDCKIIKA